uniref:cGMP-dependent protein kinase n=1 Tax=Triparma pacifica TaxID=91992 RepID=A0A7S2QVC4_9STRA|mmetsp:Transcript_1750/g.3430  ORF Transcript_1750/g.3430 Transcript_1750/m.3430 type:complete len:1064 (+) Transcript_1750:131-3322(+)|eukprot:CAMPEP_0118656580 /NCGR_PEP_ID=MMETSP0785-20121206/13562_1 /TAXON_ID=91992 /ORGANISM="Bolidomonas pacifica, Strain CCMP 1866" /LENGTH=1063 /DNA_ID=CAMNT_0006549443 /DNA_START=122 /DNA_END=3313 /DNA_ORIENTATION=+
MGNTCAQPKIGSQTYSTDNPEPLTKAQIQKRIVCSPKTETMSVSCSDCKFEIHHAYLSQRGYYPSQLNKANQDAFCSHPNYNDEKNIGLWGVFDGHGSDGDHVSNFAKLGIAKNCKEQLKKVGCESGKFADATEEQIMKAHHNAFVQTNKESDGKGFDAQLSGTTAITVFIRGNIMFVNNVGDSRAVVAVRNDSGGLKAEHLSIDQTPFRKDERERVKKCGATVRTIDQIEGLEPIHENWGINLGEEVDESGDPPRVWEWSLQRPGCAFTRSIGDHVAECIGVFAEPEPLIRGIDEETAFVVIASDGVWEFLTSQSVIDMVASYKGEDGPLEACKAVVAESYGLWLRYEVRTDDITMIVLSISGYEQKSGESSRMSSKDSINSPVRRTIIGQKTILHTESGSAGNIQRPVRRQMSKAKRRMIAERRTTEVNSAANKFVLEDHVKPKSDEERARIEKHIQSNFLFLHMTAKQKEAAISCMEMISVSSGDVIIKQGDAGDKFYIVDSGTFDVGVRNDEGVVQTVLTYENPGSAFGELSLMYGKPRAATVTATSEGKLWAINRIAFRSCMLKRNTAMDLISILKKVDVLKPLTIPQLQRLCDCMAEEEHEEHDVVIKQGETGERIYIVESGELVVTQHDEEHGAEREMMKLGKNDYFGERALMYNEARAATIVACTHVKLLTCSRQAFEEVVGDLKSLIARDQEKRESRLQRMSTYRVKSNQKEVNSLRGADRAMFDVKLVISDGEGKLDLENGLVGSFKLMSKGKVPIMYGMKAFNKKAVLESGESKGLEQERSILSSFDGQSPFIPILLGTFQTSTCCFSVLQQPLCLDLGTLMGDDETTLTEEDAKFYISCIVMGIGFLQKEGYMMRMVNPSSILMSQNGYPILANLTKCKKLTGQKSFTMCGDQAYMAPEMITSEGYDFSVDCWGLGVLGYEMIVGYNPFGTGDTNETEVYESIAGWGEGGFGKATGGMVGVSGDCKDFIDGLMTIDPTKRLGGNGVQDIKTCAWLREVSWMGLGNMDEDSPAIEICKRQLYEYDNKAVVDKFKEQVEEGDNVDDEEVFKGF